MAQTTNVYSPDYDNQGNPKPSIPELKDGIEDAKNRVETAVGDVEQIALDLGAFGGVDDTVQTTGDLPSSSGDDSVIYVLDDTRYYQDTGSGSVAGGWEQVGPNISIDATQVGHVVSVPKSADSKAFITSNFSTIEDAIQAAVDHAANSAGGRVLLSEDHLPYDASSVSFDASVRMVRNGQRTDVFDVRAYGAKGKNVDLNDPATMQDDTAAIQAAIDAATATDQLGETVYLPPGTYTLDDDHLRMRGNNFELRGAGFYWTTIRRINISNPSASITNNVIFLFPHRSQDDVRQVQIRKLELGPYKSAGNDSPTIQMGGSSEVTDDGAANVNITETEFFKVRFTHSNVCFKNFGDGIVAGTRVESCAIEGINNAVYQLRGGDTRKWSGRDNHYNDIKGPLLQIKPNSLTTPSGGVSRIALRPIAIKKHAGPLVDVRNTTPSSNVWGVSIQGGRLRLAENVSALLNSPENGEHITDFSLTGMNVFPIDGGGPQYDWISRWKDANLLNITIAANHLSTNAFADTHKNLTRSNYTMGLNHVDAGAALTAKDNSTVDTTYGSAEEGVIKNNRTRIEEIEARLQEQGLIS
jgi:hypothetical protein